MGKNKARLSILSRLLSFPMLAQSQWQTHYSDGAARVGDLVSLSCAPTTKWYLSWVVEIKGEDGRFTEYLLESIEDGSLCWWSNVGINIYCRETVADNPAWKWTDKQYDLNARWHRVCKKHDAYIVLPCPPVFHDDGSVTLNVRIRYGLNDFSNKQTFPNWKKLTMQVMEEYYTESCRLYESSKEAQ
jgi:hypothetical protein